MNFIWFFFIFFGFRPEKPYSPDTDSSGSDDSGETSSSDSGHSEVESTDGSQEESTEQPLTDIQIIVKNLMGENFTLEVNPTETIREIKAKIEEKGWSPISMILFDGDELDRENFSLSDYKIQNGSKIFVVYRFHEIPKWINPENEARVKANKTLKIWFWFGSYLNGFNTSKAVIKNWASHQSCYWVTFPFILKQTVNPIKEPWTMILSKFCRFH